MEYYNIPRDIYHVSLFTFWENRRKKNHQHRCWCIYTLCGVSTERSVYWVQCRKETVSRTKTTCTTRLRRGSRRLIKYKKKKKRCTRKKNVNWKEFLHFFFLNISRSSFPSTPIPPRCLIQQSADLSLQQPNSWYTSLFPLPRDRCVFRKNYYYSPKQRFFFLYIVISNNNSV